MKKIATILLLYCLTCSILNAQVDQNFHLYLLIGQSNMAGRGKVDSLSKQVNVRILMLDSLNQWVQAKDPVHFDKPTMVGVGPALSFATSMLEQKPQITIGLIPCAWGGSPIKVWQTGATYLQKIHPYDYAIQRTRLAMQKGVLKGILWHQGESDNDSTHAAIYLQKIQQLVTQLRSDLKQPSVPFIAGEIGYFNKVDFINPIIRQIPTVIPHSGVVSAQGLSDKGDHLHFDATSARTLGKRYAVLMQEISSKK